MTRWWTGLGLGFSLLATSVLSGSCYAVPQQAAPSAGVESSTGASGTENHKAGKPEGWVEAIKQPEDRENSVGLHLLKNIAEDQKAVWIGPKNVRWVDADWLVPLGGAAAGMFVTDSSYSRHLSNSPNRIKYSKDLSNYGIASMIGIGGGLYVWGHLTHDDHKIETGILAGEAAIDTLGPVYAMKYAFGRERPLQDNYRGRFGQGGVSFPSQHAAAAWSIASVIAHEYPGPLTSLLVYGLASAVSASRISGKQHFPSDVLVGSAIGWFEGMYVYRKHHDPRIGGGEWETYAEAQSRERNAGNTGSPYIPLDSWIYPAMERLAGLGLLNDEFLGMRPWTRSECARLVSDAADLVVDGDRGEAEESRLVEALQREFRAENEGTLASGAVRLESLYSRTEHISGAPLTDGYTFGQTQINDFGRPYGEGWSAVNGFSAYTTAGRWTAYVRGEEQSAPTIPAYSLATRQTIQQVDLYPQLPPGTSRSSVNQFKLLDAYVGVTLSNWEISFGKQSLWWGPGDGGPLILSDNAEPFNMFRINRVAPLKLPSILGWLGPMRTEFFLGQFTGYQYVFSPSGVGFNGQFGQALSPQPIIHGEKISFRPTRNFEFGFSRTTIYGGPGYPLTLHTFLRSVFSTANKGTFGTPEKPGDRQAGLDFSYRLPKLRDWLTFYGDGFTDDQFSPIAYPDRSAWHAGLYLSRFPRIPKLDLRVEGVYTDNPLGGAIGHGFYYFNFTYRSGKTNDGNLFVSWIGRQGQGAQAWTNYWFTPRNRLQFNFRHQKVSQEFLPGGGTLTDAGVRADYWVRSNISVSTSVQYERWLFPTIQPGPQTNVGASVEILFQPEKLFHRSTANEAVATSEDGGRP
jgi:Capsule assembly protein Wzi/PAP2 superfamily